MNRIRATRLVALKCVHQRVEHAVIVEVTTDDGLVGFGEIQSGAAVPAIVAAMLDEIREGIIGKDPACYRQIIEELRKSSYVWARRGLAIGVIGAIETALIDLSARKLDVPMYQLLGGAVRDRLKVYASISGEEGQTEEQVEKELEESRRRGFAAVKIRIGKNPSRDTAFVRSVREAVGDEVDIAVDAGQQYQPKPWSLIEAMYIARSLEEFRLLWLEDPYDLNDLQGWQKLRRDCRVPIAGGEGMTTFSEACQLVELNAIDVLQSDVNVIGGPTEHRKIADFAAARGIPVANHTWGTAIAIMANIHAQFAAEKHLAAELPFSANPLREVFQAEPIVHGGCISLPGGPGLGVKLTPEIEKEFGWNWREAIG